MIRGLLVAAASSDVGKTTVTLGLLSALRRRGVDVVSAKSGPDFLDPTYHRAATGRDCLTFDPWAADPAQLRARAGALSGAVAIIEGAMGLYDGADDGTPAGGGNAATLAKALDAPVILVLDAGRAGQGAAAVARGLKDWPGAPNVVGAILNRVGSARHARLVCRAVETILPVLGAIPRDPALATPSRHLGLVQAEERPDLGRFLDEAARSIAENVDIDRLLEMARPLATASQAARLDPPGQRIALARDASFSFIYPHMIADWRRAGAEVLPFAPLSDQTPDPSADAIFLPGGYPELHAGRLAAAEAFRAGVRAAARAGVTVVGECGGYMVLGQGLVDGKGVRHPMLGLLALETDFSRPARLLGYRKLEAVAGPWAGRRFRGHEYHHSRTVRAEGPPLWRIESAAGEKLGTTGLVQGSVSGSFAHLIEPEG